jgi:hypothetical protein
MREGEVTSYVAYSSMICTHGERCKERIGLVKNGFALKLSK